MPLGIFLVISENRAWEFFGMMSINAKPSCFFLENKLMQNLMFFLEESEIPLYLPFGHF